MRAAPHPVHSTGPGGSPQPKVRWATRWWRAFWVALAVAALFAAILSLRWVVGTSTTEAIQHGTQDAAPKLAPE